MPNLRATRYRVQNYRNVSDSGWIDLEAVTALVGRNESGKSALLKALHKFNPATPEPYDPQREFPRDRFTSDFRQGKDWPVCSVVFEISPPLRERLQAMSGTIEAPTQVTYTRNYDGSLRYTFEPRIDDLPVPGQEIADALKVFVSAARRLRFEEAVADEAGKAIRADLIAWGSQMEAECRTHTSLRTPGGVALLERLIAEANAKSRAGTADLIEKLLESAAPALDAAKLPPLGPRLAAETQRHLPVFIYFEDYGTLDSAVYLPRLLEDIQRSPGDAKVRTINAMFKHVGLTAQEIFDLGIEAVEQARRDSQEPTSEMIAQDQKKKELRAVTLNSASLDITRKFSAWWQQRRHEIHYSADGPYFRIWVADDRRPGVLIELESRSRGFQWFFSFYLVFLVESAEGHKDAVLLLDEPGLHLHPTAQQELIRFFEELSKKNQLIYSTHSPFLIDAERIHRVRPVTEDATGHSTISNDTWPADRETLFPLQAAAGYEMMRHLFRKRKTVLVEGLSDYLYIHGLSLVLAATAHAPLPDDVYVVPAGGTSMVGQIAALFLGDKVRPLILLDADQAGIVRRNSLLKKLYAGHENAILMLSEPLELERCEVEDVVGEAMLLPVVNELVGTFELNDDDRSAGSLPEQIEHAAARLNLVLPDGWRPESARRLVVMWASTNPASLPADFVERASRVITSITDRVAQLQPAVPASAGGDVADTA